MRWSARTWANMRPDRLAATALVACAALPAIAADCSDTFSKLSTFLRLPPSPRPTQMPMAGAA